MFGSSCEKYLKIMGKKVNCSNLSEKLIGVFVCVSVRISIEGVVVCASFN